MLSGRLGLDTARVPHADRHGLLWLSRGNLYVQDGCVRFAAASGSELPAGDYGIPFQTVSLVLLGPGTSVTHDVLRLCARHGTGILAVGTDGVRCYSAPPLAPDQSAIAREQVRLWNDINGGWMMVARKLYAMRLGEVLRKHPVNSRLSGESAGYSSVSLWFGVDPSSLWASGAHSPCCHSPAVA